MYYPKSQVKTGLYTNGGEYILSTTQEEYIGYYFETSTGKRYTGKNPNSSAIELILFSFFGEATFSPSNPKLQLNNFKPETIISQAYPSTFNSNIEVQPRAIPQFGPTYPTEEEKQKGTFTRYFCKKNNEYKYIEITKSTHDRLINKNTNIAWDLYSAFSLNWRIKGDINQTYASNQASVSTIESQLSYLGFTQYFKGDFLKYYVEE